MCSSCWYDVTPPRSRIEASRGPMPLIWVRSSRCAGAAAAAGCGCRCRRRRARLRVPLHEALPVAPGGVVGLPRPVSTLPGGIIPDATALTELRLVGLGQRRVGRDPGRLSAAAALGPMPRAGSGRPRVARLRRRPAPPPGPRPAPPRLPRPRRRRLLGRGRLLDLELVVGDRLFAAQLLDGGNDERLRAAGLVGRQRAVEQQRLVLVIAARPCRSNPTSRPRTGRTARSCPSRSPSRSPHELVVDAGVVDRLRMPLRTPPAAPPTTAPAGRGRSRRRRRRSRALAPPFSAPLSLVWWTMMRPRFVRSTIAASSDLDVGVDRVDLLEILAQPPSRPCRPSP